MILFPGGGSNFHRPVIEATSVYRRRAIERQVTTTTGAKKS